MSAEHGSDRPAPPSAPVPATEEIDAGWDEDAEPTAKAPAVAVGSPDGAPSSSATSSPPVPPSGEQPARRSGEVLKTMQTSARKGGAFREPADESLCANEDEESPSERDTVPPPMPEPEYVAAMMQAADEPPASSVKQPLSGRAVRHWKVPLPPPPPRTSATVTAPSAPRAPSGTSPGRSDPLGASASQSGRAAAPSLPRPLAVPRLSSRSDPAPSGQRAADVPESGPRRAGATTGSQRPAVPAVFDDDAPTIEATETSLAELEALAGMDLDDPHSAITADALPEELELAASVGGHDFSGRGSGLAELLDEASSVGQHVIFGAETVEIEAVSVAPASRPPLGNVYDPHSREVDRIRSRIDAGDFSGALVLAEALLEEAPQHTGARAFTERCRNELRRVYLARLGTLEHIPLRILRDSPDALGLDERAAKLLERVDGRTTLSGVLQSSGLSELEALRVLFELVQRRILLMRSPPGPRRP